MKNVVFLLFGLFAFHPSIAQQMILTGQVTIHNSHYTTGQIEPVRNAYVSLPTGGSDDTDENGLFRLSFVGIKAGTTVQIKVEKYGYEVVNPRDLQVVVGRTTPIRIYLATRTQLDQARAELYEVSLRELNARYQRQITRLRQDGRESQAVIASLEQKLRRHIADRVEAERLLTEQLKSLQNQLPELVEQLALQNLDFASNLYLNAYEHLKAGEPEQAITTLNEAQLDAQAQDALSRLGHLATGIEALKDASSLQQNRVGQFRRRSLLDWDCQFSSCNTPFFGYFNHTFLWEVAGAEYNDLSTAAQGVCAVEIYFDHQFASDLQISLVSPAGQIVSLIRVDFPNDTTHAARWSVRFVSCNQLATPDLGMLENFDDNYWPKGQHFTGTYYPASYCLEDFNAGPVNGKWSLQVSHRGQRGIGYLHGFKIEFWQNQGLYCTGLYRETIQTKPEDSDETLPRDPRKPNPRAAAEAAAKALRDNVVNSARDLIDTPYKYGGNNIEGPKKGVDCSNFTSIVYRQNGLDNISPSSKIQSTQGRFVWLDHVQPADLIFFGDQRHIQHVALVVGHTANSILCVHSTTSKGVIEEDITKSSYWMKRILFARDVITPYEFQWP